ncbi:MAG: hypothetical protein ACOVNY_00475 [Chitinophagaceae bacterium]
MRCLFIALFSICTFISCNNEDVSSDKFDKDSYQKSKESLAEKEKSSPKTFLKITGTDKRRWLFGTTIYKGTIENTATTVAYKDVRVKLLYFNEEKEQVANHEELLDEIIEPNASINFKAKYKTPKGTDSVYAYIMSAKPVKE